MNTLHGVCFTLHRHQGKARGSRHRLLNALLGQELSKARAKAPPFASLAEEGLSSTLSVNLDIPAVCCEVDRFGIFSLCF